jgi:hypothetical protein
VSKYEDAIKDVAVRLTINSITDVLRVYKVTLPKDQYQVGYNEGLGDAIKAVQLFLKVLDEKKEQPLDE